MKIFLAAPYTHPDPEIVNARVTAINAHTALLMNQSHIVFSPISHSHYIAMENDLPTTFEFWKKQNHEFIVWCDSIVILKLDGWKESKGVKDELEFARILGKGYILENPVMEKNK